MGNFYGFLHEMELKTFRIRIVLHVYIDTIRMNRRGGEELLTMWAFVIIYSMTVNIEMPEIFKTS